MNASSVKDNVPQGFQAEDMSRNARNGEFDNFYEI